MASDKAVLHRHTGGNCFVASYSKRSSVPQHGVVDDEVLASDGNEDGLGRFALDAHPIAHRGEAQDAVRAAM